MDPLTMLAIGAGVGLLKNELIDRPKEKRSRALAAETQRLSPWTKMQANEFKEADPFGAALTYGGTGAQLGAGIQQAQLNEKLGNKWLDDPNARIINPMSGSTDLVRDPNFLNQGTPWSRMVQIA